MMADDSVSEATPTEEPKPQGLFAQHPKLGILIIAAMFYLVLFAMCGFVLVIIWQGRT